MKIRYVLKNKVINKELTSPIEVRTIRSLDTINEHSKNECYSDFIMIVNSEDLGLKDVALLNALIMVEEDVVHFINFYSENESLNSKFVSDITKNLDSIKERLNKEIKSTTHYSILKSKKIQLTEIKKFLDKQIKKIDNPQTKKIKTGGVGNV